MELASNIVALVKKMVSVFGTMPKPSSAFMKGNIAKTYQEMTGTAEALAAKEASADIHLIGVNRLLGDMEAKEQGKPAERHTLLEKEFLKAFEQRRAYHLDQMFKIMELYVKSKWGGNDKP